MKYIVYLTTNKINGKIYIGVHQTENPDKFDGYLGCGAFKDKPSSYNKGKTYFHNALIKYGTSAFHRKVLKVFDNLQDALDLETFLVTEDFVKRTDTYNMTVGGNVPPIFNKIIYQFDLQGNFIKKWDSIKNIISEYNVNHDRIWMAIKNKRSFNNCYWYDKPSINVSEFRLSSHGYVYQYNKDGILLHKFSSASEAALKLDLDKQAIVNAVYNRCTLCGFYFLRPDEDINILLYDKSKKIMCSITSVYRYTLSGKFNKEYKSIADAVKDTPKSSRPNIIRAIKNNRTCAGYRWSYIKSDSIQEFKKTDIKSIKIAQYNLDHELIKIWDSVKECKKYFPSCQKVCRKERKSSHGFIFEYIS